MTKLSRRDFLKLPPPARGALTLGAFLDACSQMLSPTSPATQPPSAAPVTLTSPSGSATATVSRTAMVSAQPASASAQPTGSPVPIPDLVVTKGGEPEALVRQALAALGGMSRFVSKAPA